MGCDDSAIRIWDLMKKGDGGEACQVLLGHKNGFPVFDLSWNKDGRSLLSAGGDGSVRLWDTMAQGPFGQATKPNSNSSSINGKKTTSAEKSTSVEMCNARATIKVVSIHSYVRTRN